MDFGLVCLWILLHRAAVEVLMSMILAEAGKESISRSVPQRARFTSAFVIHFTVTVAQSRRLRAPPPRQHIASRPARRPHSPSFPRRTHFDLGSYIPASVLHHRRNRRSVSYPFISNLGFERCLRSFRLSQLLHTPLNPPWPTLRPLVHRPRRSVAPPHLHRRTPALFERLTVRRRQRTESGMATAEPQMLVLPPVLQVMERTEAAASDWVLEA